MSDGEEIARKRVREIVLEMSPATQSLAPAADSDLVDDLEYHSLALMELAFALEEEFALPPIDESAARQIRTVSDVEAFVIAHEGQRDDRALATDGLA